ncbi:2-C-methyl-D-erythritol 4-phosphate cytidylyltransferase [Anaerobranca gottschalkii]|uniref:2-C-methyl-D-erythritol 4-phosphate cytidylyltransferase n=1 Tax=Anaerobranca gottschalkii DSM 13577 TaxID=1120990 RepID=A0A1I0B6D5_9FIRM|nr:2-C-methyl-D-erythritol 4-phosphate cytidylyltransferase [Anaerobranca gottschalkii]SET01969.1 2-C-methyl-D-erythritol 4-phosphate cytidylyltransferase [Anaerobranca gottschalkii DSM 13577]
MKNIALIVAAGSGNRMGTNIKKQYLKLAGQPMLARTVLIFEKSKKIDEIIIVIPQGDEQFVKKEILKDITFTKPIRLVSGGFNRGESVYNGLKTLTDSGEDIVLIHDGARPFINESLIERLLQFLRNNPKEIGVIPVIKVKDTIKIVKEDTVISTPPRNDLYAAQTPQCFYVSKLLPIFKEVEKELYKFTDESSLVEAFGYKIKTVLGEEHNIKITTPQDLLIGEFLLKEGLA